MGKSDKHSDDFSEIRDRRQTARGGSREGGGPREGDDRSRRPETRDREQEDWKLHPHEDSPAEWDEEDRPNA
ncbi:hypothetical protein [Streptomyces radiopugnans]|uniref:Uncharacterized protein n=1 Tax=Streptomyces radiopugnans TaxID=403935 RepID=A0A1H9H138_9ACTN|nr:hypothetical protein [Streptomyces radiopugnans]SEQ56062.1 hypothetical protein SAMN05216481_11047 [Streptomyces radiopugnans]